MSINNLGFDEEHGCINRVTRAVPYTAAVDVPQVALAFTTPYQLPSGVCAASSGKNITFHVIAIVDLFGQVIATLINGRGFVPLALTVHSQ